VIEFRFAAVPFEKNGAVIDLAFDGLACTSLRPGVILMSMHGMKEMPARPNLLLDEHEFDEIDRESEDALSALTLRRRYSYILLLPQRETLEQLRKAGDKTRRRFTKTFLDVFLRNADEALRLHGPRAALLIY